MLFWTEWNNLQNLPRTFFWNLLEPKYLGFSLQGDWRQAIEWHNQVWPAMIFTFRIAVLFTVFWDFSLKQIYKPLCCPTRKEISFRYARLCNIKHGIKIKIHELGENGFSLVSREIREAVGNLKEKLQSSVSREGKRERRVNKKELRLTGGITPLLRSTGSMLWVLKGPKNCFI